MGATLFIFWDGWSEGILRGCVHMTDGPAATCAVSDTRAATCAVSDTRAATCNVSDEAC